MALTVTDLSKSQLKEYLFEVTGDNAYAAGGYALTADMFGLTTLVAVIPVPTGGSCIPVWDRANSKLKFVKGAASTTVTTGSGGFSEAATNDTYLTTTKALLRVIGT
jgi:hypothetical protein